MPRLVAAQARLEARGMSTVVTNSIDEDIWEEVWDEERSWREEHPAREQVPEPFALVIFGATGDLTHRKLIPALYSLSCDDLLPDTFRIIGFARSDRQDAQFRQSLRDALDQSGAHVRDRDWKVFADRVTYVQGSYDDPSSFERLAGALDQIDEELGTEN